MTVATLSLSVNQFDALKAFAAKHGRRWKTTLRETWETGQPVPGFPGLYELRNSCGPSWLQKIRLPAGEIVEQGPVIMPARVALMPGRPTCRGVDTPSAFILGVWAQENGLTYAEPKGRIVLWGTSVEKAAVLQEIGL